MKLYIFYLLILFSAKCFSQSNSSKLREVKEYSFKSKKIGNFKWKSHLNCISKYDSTGKKINDIFYRYNKIISHFIVYNYDIKGDCISIITLNNVGEITNEHKTILDKEGNVIPYLAMNTIDFCTQRSQTIKCKYDERGFVTKILEYDEKTNKLISTYRYTYSFW